VGGRRGGLRGARAHHRLARPSSARDDIAIVDICTPPGTHAEIAAAAAAAGKAVLCEKPLAGGRTPAPAAALGRPSPRPGYPTRLSFNYRRLPAVCR